LILDVQAALQVFVSKKVQLRAAGLQTSIQDGLATLEEGVDSFLYAIIAIASIDTETQANFEKDVIGGYFLPRYYGLRELIGKWLVYQW
jgi:hypothetical protein